MIGMSQIKKKTIQGIVIGFAIGLVGVGLTLWWAISTIKTYENGTNKKYNRLYTQDVTVLTKDAIQGEVITEDMLTTVRVHKKTVPTGALEQSAISGQVAKYNIAANVPVTDSMLTTEIISADIRSQEINTVLMPSDLEEGDYVDVRVMFPNGTDYIVLAQKQVQKISGQTMWLNLAEDERLILNSSMVDSFLNTGTKLYSTKYTDSDAQIKLASASEDTAKGYLSEAIKTEIDAIKTESTDDAVDAIFDLVLKYKNFATATTKTTENYQPNTQVMDMMSINKNILSIAKEKLSAEARANIENGITNYKSDSGDDYNNVISGAQTSITDQKALRTELLTPTVE